jgi:hypothetical protein
MFPRPPGPPWRAFKDPTEVPVAYLSIYLSDGLARLPIRGVTLPGNSKSDPNLETLTFGVFSTCEPKLRAGMVARGSRLVFFATSHKDRGRALTGYYHLGWWAEGSLGAGRGDYALAADHGRFTDPIPFAAISGPAGEYVRRPFRTFRLLPAEFANTLRSLLDQQPDRTDAYIAEIHRLERFNEFHTGFRYAGWAEGGGFDWNAAIPYLEPANSSGDAVLNESPSAWWYCRNCLQNTYNKALLKRCPGCGAVGTLTALPNPP